MTTYRPQRPAQDHDLELFTFQDAVDHVLDAFDLDAQRDHLRRAKRAVLEAYREIPNSHNWSYLTRRGQVSTVASQTDGSIAYDHTGGTNEREVTLSGATFPSDARDYMIQIDNIQYPIQEYISSTVVTLGEGGNPGADVASGTSYVLFRSSYDLPWDFKRGQNFQVMNQWWVAEHVSLDQMLSYLNRNYEPEDIPKYYTLRNAGNNYSGMAVEFAPPPLTARTYDFVYTADTRPLRSFGKDTEYTTGTISSSGTTVTGSGTSWTSRMVGCVIRSSANDEVPTGHIGSKRADNPYDEQRIVTAVNSTTELEVDSAFDSTLSEGTEYSIGDPLDVEPNVMLTPLLHLSEAVYSRLTDKKDKDRRWQKYIDSLKSAMGADYRAGRMREHQPYYLRNLADVSRA